MRIHSKRQLVDEIEESWEQLWTLVDTFQPEQMSKRVCSPRQSASRSINDALAHVHAWHLLFLNWYKIGESGGTPEIPAPGFKWSQTPQLNHDLHEKWKDISYASIRRRLKLSHRRVCAIATSLSERQLLSVGVFKWTGNLSIAKYLAGSTASHYRWAVKAIKKISKQLS